MDPVTYEEMLERLLGTARFGMTLGLSRMETALAALGAPHLRLGRVAHVGGTNGKGSTAAMLAEMMARAGWRTGLYTSPHLSRFTERVRIAGAEVGRDALAGRYARMMAAAPPGLTMFEQVTLLAFMSFAEERCDAVVLEVGLGGRLDATNVVDAEVAVVTGVALDHQEVLGGDLAAIAREKAGIFKPGRVAIVGSGGEPEAVPVLVAEARARGADVRLAGCEIPSGWTLALAGAHQRCNAASALAAATALGVPEEARRAGLETARWPGRIERVGRVILDAAHNPQAAAALARALEAESRPLVLLVAVSADKDAAGILAPLAPRARAIVVTEAPSSRAMAAAALARFAPRAEVVQAWPAALARAQALAGEDGLVVAFGSIFLVGALRAALLGEAVDPVAVHDPARVGP